ncbi:uncharacterized protein LOC132758865 [Ruditapes philippinarum]|uniref:uncharacterized protein LOC132758865 n=1 Tax=Ruditapes philippinarum TaxID=129788 RepID=UPI00295BBD13|nr:uncharacterized protein LOC132758865 [Ruditapes philippinarum]
MLVTSFPLNNALFQQAWLVHGGWQAGGRRLEKVDHISCTFSTSVPFDNFEITVESSEPLKAIKTWSLEQVSEGSQGRVFTFQNIVRMYPPRIVLNFHITTFGMLEPSGNCSFTTRGTEQSTVKNHPWLLNDESTMGYSTMSTSTGFSFIDPMRVNPCVEKSVMFPDTAYVQPKVPESLPPGVTTTGMPLFRPFPLRPGNRLPLPAPRLKREIWNPSLASLPPPPPPAPFQSVTINYPDAIERSMMFYEAQRSGDFHLSSLSQINGWAGPSGEFHTTRDGKDLSGGWYNGNGNVKLTFPMAAATTVLAWGYNVWKDTYEHSSLKLNNKFKKMIRWPLDYFLKSWDLETETLYVQIGNLTKERTMWERADNDAYKLLWDRNEWPVYSVSPSKPGSDVAAEVASAMALSSLIEFDSADDVIPTTTEGHPNGFWLGRNKLPERSPRQKRATDDDEYNSKLLNTAEQIYRLAKTYPGKYSDVVPVASKDYPDYTSSGYEDELCFAASVLHDVTGKSVYLSDAIVYFDKFASAGTPKYFSWDDKRTACAVILYKITRKQKYASYLQDFRKFWLDTSGQTTFNGFAWRSENGTLSVTANAIFILLQSIEAGVFENEVATEIYIWSSKQINYMLGANGMHYSYLIGYGNEYVKNPYHKNSACSKSKECGWSFYESLSDNQNTLIGALVGGPDVNDYHTDTRQNKLGNSVALDYNAGFQSALAGLEKKNLQLEKRCRNHNGGIEFSTPHVIQPLTDPTSATKYSTTEPTPVPNKPTSFNYTDALRKSILFYAAQRSGTQPEFNPIPWRRWYTEETETSGGWYDDGSAVKTTKVMASAVIMIGWGAVKFKAGYETAGLLHDLYDSLRWPLDYFIKIWLPDIQGLIQKVGLEAFERGMWSRPESRYGMNNYLVNYALSRGQKEGADVAGDVATALVIGAEIFKENDTSYSDRLMVTAKDVYTFAKQLERTYQDYSSVHYSDPGESYADEMCVAAWWMYRVTKNSSYYDDGMKYSSMITVDSLLEWKTKNHLCHILRAVYEENGNTDNLREGLDYWRKDIQKTPQGLAWYKKDPLKFAANGAFLHVLTQEEVGLDVQPTDFHKTQIDYMLGNNVQAFSYQVGYGPRYPRRPHHRASSCPDFMEYCDWSIYNVPGRNPFELTGALVSGPDINDVYEDIRSNYSTNRVSVEHNAGFQSVLAYMVMKESSTKTTSNRLPSTTTVGGLT